MTIDVWEAHASAPRIGYNRRARVLFLARKHNPSSQTATEITGRNSGLGRIRGTKLLVTVGWKVKGRGRFTSLLSQPEWHGEQTPRKKRVVSSGDSLVEIRAEIRGRYRGKNDIPIVAAQQKYSPA